MRYSDFIEELRRLRDQARQLRNAAQMHEDPKFRRWRNELESVVAQIRGEGYEPPGAIRMSQRTFGASTGADSVDTLHARYRREMEDTANELKAIIVAFDKYGVPRTGAEAKVGAKSASTTTPHPSIREHIENHPIVYFLGAAVTAFGLGFAARGALNGAVVPRIGGDQPAISPAIGEQVAMLREAHDKRLAELHVELMKVEAAASDITNPESWQEQYRKSAERIRASIAEENRAFASQVQVMLGRWPREETK